MSDNAEEGIARAQASAAQSQGAAGLGKHHAGTIGYLNERIIVALLAMSILGLMVLWATAKSPLLLYGSFAGVIALILLWGYVRIRRIEATRRERAQQAQAWNNQDQS